MSTKVFANMLGKTIDKVHTGNWGNELTFEYGDGQRFVFRHVQDCCESVSIEDICGDLSDLEGEPLIIAEEVDGTPPDNSYGTWTFYRFATRKGTVTVRWFGTSNGYYSESVSYFEE